MSRMSTRRNREFAHCGGFSLAGLLLGREKTFLPPGGLSCGLPERRGRCLPVQTCTDLKEDVPCTSAPVGAACPTATRALHFSDFPFITLMRW